MENCKIKGEKGITSKFVCEKHFEMSCIGLRKLKLSSIPTILPFDIPNSNPFLKVPEKATKKCCLIDCQKIKTGKLFRFPTEKSLADQWVQALGFDAGFKTKSKFVCEKHFMKSLILKQKLKKGSIPTVSFNVFEFQNLSASSNCNSSKHNEFEEAPDLEVNRRPNVRSYLGPAAYPPQEDLQLSDFLTLNSPPRKSIANANISVCCPSCEKYMKNKSFYIEKNSLLHRKLKNANLKNLLLRKQIQNYHNKFNSIEKVINNIEYANENTKEFCKMLLKPKNTTYTEKQKNLALNLNYKSNSCNNFMRQSLNLQLPSRSSIFQWTPIKKLQPGFNELLI